MTFNELGEKLADKLADNAVLTDENRQLRAECDRLRSDNESLIGSLKEWRLDFQHVEADRDRLRKLIRMAYCEGWNNYHRLENIHNSWLRSESRAALQEGKQ